MRYQLWTQTARSNSQHVEYSASCQWAHNLELEGNDSEVEDLYSRPEHEVGLESREIYVLELPCNRSLSTTLCNSHERKETCQP